jgi:hypothetical protein
MVVGQNTGTSMQGPVLRKRQAACWSHSRPLSCLLSFAVADAVGQDPGAGHGRHAGAGGRRWRLLAAPDAQWDSRGTWSRYCAAQHDNASPPRCGLLVLCHRTSLAFLACCSHALITVTRPLCGRRGSCGRRLGALRWSALQPLCSESARAARETACGRPTTRRSRLARRLGSPLQ